VNKQLLTTEDLLAIPDDGIERWLIGGQLRMAVGRFHASAQSRAIARISQILGNWCDERPEFGLEVYSRALCRVTRNPDTTVVAHVALAGPKAWSTVGQASAEVIDGYPNILIDLVDWREPGTQVVERESFYRSTDEFVWMGDPERRFIQVFGRHTADLPYPELPFTGDNSLDVELVHLLAKLTENTVFGSRTESMTTPPQTSP
jgi:hypothetical protein